MDFFILMGFSEISHEYVTTAERQTANTSSEDGSYNGSEASAHN